MGDQKDNLTF